MRLYLLRHAPAMPRGAGSLPDAERPLTRQGARRMAMAARGMARLGLKPGRILSSPLPRAIETARLAAKGLGSRIRVEICQLLRPGIPTRDLVAALRKGRVRSLLLVGHEPDLGILAASLLGVRAGFIRFRKGGLCCIALGPRPRVEWHLTPRQLRKIGKGVG